jgi:hypothetical protein
MMPFDHILQEYLKNALDDNAEYTDSEEEPDEEESPGETLNNNKMIEEAAKAIVALSEKTEESVSEALQSTFDSVYSYALESQLSNGKKNKKSKRVKDPNAPKKALSNYMVYCMRHRSDVQGKHPNAKPTEISRILGAQWNALTPDQKSKFIDTTASA